MSMRQLFAISALFFVACDDGTTPTPDGPKQDAQVAQVTEVSCQGKTPAATFVTEAMGFSPMTATVGVGQVVQFQSKSGHPIRPFNGDPAETDPAIVIRDGDTGCFVFNIPKAFKFVCGQHFYLGTIVVN